MRSGLNVPTPAIPIPDFAVPYAAPIAISHQFGAPFVLVVRVMGLQPKIIAKAMPACEAISVRPSLNLCERELTIPKNGANLGAASESAMLGKLRTDRQSGLLWLEMEDKGEVSLEGR